MQLSQNTIDESAQDLPSAYLAVKKSKGLKELTMKNYVHSLKLFEDWRTKPYEELNQSDLADYLNHLVQRGGSASTRKQRLHAVKGFLRWILTGNVISGRLSGPLPEVVAYLEVKQDVKTKQQVHITKAIMQEFLSECRTLQEQVFFSILFDTGARKGEALTIQLKHIGRDEYGNYVELNGKTGYRKNWLHDSLAWYLPYVNGLSADPETYLFPARSGTRGHIEPGVPNMWCRRIVKNLKARGILQPTDRFSPHGFRHSKARTLKNQGWSDDRLNLWLGWSAGSSMATHYGQAREQDVVNSFLEMTGQKKIDKEEDSHLICPACNSSQSSLCKFCPSCGHAMRPEYAFEQNQVKDTVEYIAEMQQAREILKTLRSLPHLAKELGLEA